ncbi:MAG: TRZ/ATZ family hydrolase [Gammaproteobacteria bacterium]
MTIDLTVSARWIIPIEPHAQVLEHHTLVVHEGKILDLLPTETALSRYQSKRQVKLNHHAIIPGLINAHAHSPMTLFRGMADDLPLMDWLNHHIWPAESRWLNEDFMRVGTELAFLEMIRSGTTCFNENYFFGDVTAEVTAQAGLRALIGAEVINVPTLYADTLEEYLKKMESFCQAWRNHPLITPSIHPQGPYTVTDEAFRVVKAYADEHQLLVHLHLHETQAEIGQSLAQFGKRPLRRLHELELVSPRLQCVHMVQINEEDLDILKDTQPLIVTCPESNLKLSSGFCPVDTLLQAGLTVAIGTDGAASNNDLDMFSEMRTASLLAKAVHQNTTALDAATTLRLATLNGAKALGLGAITGSLEINKAADFIAIDLSWPNTQPIYQPISQIVYAANSRQVTDVWVAGKQLLNKGEYTYLDQERIVAEAQIWQKRILGHH